PKADADQDQILLLLTDDTTPIDLYLYSQKKKKACRIGFHNAWLQEVTLSVPLLLQMETKRSADADSPENPGSVQGWVMPPVSRQEEVPKHSVPSFHYVPDGPEVSYTTGFDFERQAMAANGLAVIYCNPRGCACHRPDSEKESPSSYETACQDLCHFTDLAMETFPWLDPDNVCIGGGWLINDICCHTDRFKAAVAQHPWSNPSTSCGIGDTDLFSQSFLGTSGLQEYLYSKAHSASIVDIDCWKTPCLILHGQNDSICPLEQGEQLYSALRDRCPDVPRRMVVFPGENHEIKKTGLLHWQIRHLKEMIDWCLKYTTAKNASEPTVDSSKSETAPPSNDQKANALSSFSVKQSRISLESLLPVDRKDQESTSGKRLPVMEDYLKMQYIGQPAAGAGFAAWTQSFQPIFENHSDPGNTGRFREQIHLKSLPDSMLCKKEQEWILTAGGQEEHSPYIAEDGSVYFLSDASLPLPYPAVGTLEDRTVNEFFAFSQLYVRTRDGILKKLTSMLHGVEKYQVSRDRTRILLQCWQYDRDSLSDMVKERTREEVQKELDKRSREPIVCEGAYFKSDTESGYQSRRHRTLWLLNLTEETLTCLLDKDSPFHAPVFSPEEQDVLFARNSAKGLLEWWRMPLTAPFQAEIFASLDHVALCFEPENPPLFDSTGSVMVFPGVEPNSSYADPRGLFTIPWNPVFEKDSPSLITTSKRLIDPAFDVDGILPQEFNFASQSTGHMQYLVMPDGFCYYISGLQGRTRLFRVPITGSDSKPEEVQCTDKDDAFGQAVDPAHFCSRNYQGLCAAGKDTLLTMVSDAITLPDLYLIHLSPQKTDTENRHMIPQDCAACCTLTRLTDTNPWLAFVKLQEPLELTVRTEDQTDWIQGFLLPPCSPDQESSPAILYCHGGPTGFYSTALNYEFQTLSAAGFAVLFANPRGGTGYGKQHNHYEYAFDNTAMNDLLSFVREACKKYTFIDSDRIGICGGSYGGYMTAWTASHSSLFKAACAHRPLLNLQMIRYSSHSAGQSSREEFESFLDSMFDCIRSSPNTYADKITIPFQILQSERDANCVPEQAYQLYNTLKALHPQLPSRLVLYPDSNHGLLKKGPAYLALRHRLDNLQWFLQYL
ncbi:MAG: prolyl oligopeptidase family serine peptidase, partial [Lachnospiraceae bacterium]|nr:prolyl oligopeptidase family serine peptidase [Lachnospiraceae bacterium]